MQEGAVLDSETPAQARTVEKDDLLALPADHYSRYALTREIVEALRPALPGRIRVLDVGGHSSPLGHFLPNDSITLLDVEPVGTLTSVALRCDQYVQGSGAALPFRDNAFDLVAAHDTLEHVPPSLREPLLAELVRVARKGVVLTGPVWQDDVVAAEARIDRFVREVMGWQQPFLAEHIELGLPRPEDIEGFFTRRGLTFTCIPAGDLGRWFLMLAVRHYLAALPGSEEVRQQIDVAYNAAVPPGDLSPGLCYRRAFVVALDDEVTAALPAVDRRVGELLASRSLGSLGLFEPLIESLRAHAASVGAELSRLNEALYEAQKRAFELQETHDRIARSLGDREAQAREQEETIAARDAELLAIRTELMELKSSPLSRVVQSGPYRTLRRGLRRLRKRRPQ